MRFQVFPRGDSEALHDLQNYCFGQLFCNCDGEKMQICKVPYIIDIEYNKRLDHRRSHVLRMGRGNNKVQSNKWVWRRW